MDKKMMEERMIGEGVKKWKTIKEFNVAIETLMEFIEEKNLEPEIIEWLEGKMQKQKEEIKSVHSN